MDGCLLGISISATHLIVVLTLFYICARIIVIYSMKGFTQYVPIHASSTSKNCF